MDSGPKPKERSRDSSRPSVVDPKTPVKNVRFAKLPGENTPRSLMATPASCTSACSNLSSLADTPLSAKMAKMADRCIALLDEYFAGNIPEPLSPTVQVGDDGDPDTWSIDSSSTLFSDDHSAETFHRFPELPTELQEMILEQALNPYPSPDSASKDESPPATLALAMVSKRTHEQVVRIMEMRRVQFVRPVDKNVVEKGETGT